MTDKQRDASSFSPRKYLGIANYRGITLIPIAAKIYNALLRNHIKPKIEKMLREKQNGFRRNRSTTSNFYYPRILGVRAKNLEATISFFDFSKTFDSIHRGKMEQILLAYGLPKETVEAKMMLFKNMKVSLLTRWKHRLLRHCSKCAARRYISRAENVNWFNERKRFQAGKGKKQKIPSTNNYGRGLRRWHGASYKYICPSRIPAT